MAIGFQALLALMLVHLKTTLFLEVAHGGRRVVLSGEKSLVNTFTSEL
jgi:hypothetical protein